MVNSPLPCTNSANAPYLSYAVSKKKKTTTMRSECIFRITVFCMLNRNSIITVKNVLNILWGLFQYDAIIFGGHGGGGEYEIQVGFGWTNGIIMELLQKYGDRLTVHDKFSEPEYQPSHQSESRISIAGSPSNSPVGQVLTLILALVATLAAGGIG